MNRCAWEYPTDRIGIQSCLAPATAEIEYTTATGSRRVWYCHSHAKAAAALPGGRYVPVPIRQVSEREMAQRERAQAAMTRHMRGEPE